LIENRYDTFANRSDSVTRLKAVFLLHSNSIPPGEGDRENGLYQTNEVWKRRGGFGEEDAGLRKMGRMDNHKDCL
jgi:hypothetical protein